MLDKILELLKPVSGKFSTKFLLAAGAVYFLWDLSKTGELNPMHAGIGIVIISVAYFMFRRKQEEMTNGVK